MNTDLLEIMIQLKILGNDLQEGQVVQLYQVLPLVQFDPEQDKLDESLIINDKLS